MVEQWTENPRVAGSIPALGTICGLSSSGRAPPCQGGGSEFEPRSPLQKKDIRKGCPFSFSTDGELAASTRARSAHSMTEERQGSCEWAETIRGMPGSEFEPRSPLHMKKTTCHLVSRFFHVEQVSLIAKLTLRRESNVQDNPDGFPAHILSLRNL